MVPGPSWRSVQMNSVRSITVKTRPHAAAATRNWPVLRIVLTHPPFAFDENTFRGGNPTGGTNIHQPAVAAHPGAKPDRAASPAPARPPGPARPRALELARSAAARRHPAGARPWLAKGASDRAR